MSSKLEKLIFSVALVDKVSGPVGKIMHNIDKLTRNATAGFLRIGIGLAGLAGVGRVIGGLLGPVMEMKEALGEVASLGVAESVLKSLEKTALGFSVKYGESADEFVRASYDIQSAIGGLVGDELGVFTMASAVLAKATKSDVGTITSYMGTMYGIFKDTAQKMGKADWVNMLAGQTATAVRMFKTTGGDMASAFSNLGADAESNGVALTEQLSILGILQSTMSGSEAGTKYRAFLTGVSKAQEKLGLTFTDSHGRLLPMVEVLTAIKGKFGDIDTLAESKALKDAFGTSEAAALIKLLIKDIDGLGSSINDLGKVNGLKAAEDMARKMTHSWDRLGAGIIAIKTKIGGALMPVLEPLISAMADGAQTLVKWADMFPQITRFVGYAILAVAGLVAAISGLMIVGGAFLLLKSAMFGAAIGFTIITSPILLWGVAIGALSAAVIWFGYNWRSVFDWIGEKFGQFRAMIESNPILNFLYTPLLAVVDAVGWVVDNFDRIKQWFVDFKPWLKLLNPFGLITDGIRFVASSLGLTGGGNVSASAKPPSLVSKKANRVPVGGLLNQITNNASNNNGTHIDKVEVHTKNIDGPSFADQLAMWTV